MSFDYTKHFHDSLYELWQSIRGYDSELDYYDLFNKVYTRLQKYVIDDHQDLLLEDEGLFLGFKTGSIQYPFIIKVSKLILLGFRNEELMRSNIQTINRYLKQFEAAEALLMNPASKFTKKNMDVLREKLFKYAFNKVDIENRLEAIPETKDKIAFLGGIKTSMNHIFKSTDDFETSINKIDAFCDKEIEKLKSSDASKPTLIKKPVDGSTTKQQLTLLYYILEQLGEKDWNRKRLTLLNKFLKGEPYSSGNYKNSYEYKKSANLLTDLSREDVKSILKVLNDTELFDIAQRIEKDLINES